MLRSIVKRTKEQLGMLLTIDDSAVNFLAEKGYDEKYGARPLRRTIQNEIEDKLSEEILEGRVGKSDEVEISCVDGRLVFANKILVK